jgi:hypothetical protein
LLALKIRKFLVFIFSFFTLWSIFFLR